MAVVKLGKGKAEKAEAEKAMVTLSKPRALALQTELLDAFTSPKFQKKLNEIARKHKMAEGEGRSKAYSSFRNLVRKNQREIIPQYGFDASEEGVEQMMKAFRNFKDDPDIYVNECAIKEALCLNHGQSHIDSHEMTQTSHALSESLLAESGSSQSARSAGCPGSAIPSARNLVVVWLRHLIIRFSTPTFQAFRAKTVLRFGAPEEIPKVEPENLDLASQEFTENLDSLDSPDANFGHQSRPDKDSLDRENPHPCAPACPAQPVAFANFDSNYQSYYQLLARADAKEGSQESRLEGVKMMIRKVCTLEDVEVAQLFDTMNMKLGMAADACGPFRDSLRLHLIQAEEN